MGVMSYMFFFRSLFKQYSATVDALGIIFEIFNLPESEVHASFLANNQRPLEDGKKGAWSEEAFDVKPGQEAPLATSEAVLALLPFISDSEVEEKVIKALLFLKQFQNKDDGGWEDVSGGTSLVDATGCVIAALARGQSLTLISATEHIERGVEFLISQQNDDGGWGARKDNASKIQYTYFSLLGLKSSQTILLNLSQKISGSIERAIAWIRMNHSEHDRNGVGISVRGPLNPVATALAILSFCLVGKRDLVPKTWALYLESSQITGDWPPTTDETIIPDIKIRRVYAFKTIPWAVEAFINMGYLVTSEVIQKALIALSQYQLPNGGYVKELGSRDPIVWLTALVLTMTEALRSEIKRNLQIYIKSLKKDVKDLKENVRGFVANIKLEQNIIEFFYLSTLVLYGVISYFTFSDLKLMVGLLMANLIYSIIFLGFNIVYGYWLQKRKKLTGLMGFIISAIFAIYLLVLNLILLLNLNR